MLNWNGKLDTEECLKSLMKLAYPNLQVIVVDNGSGDGSLEYLKPRFPKVLFLRSETNLGFTGGCNIGVKTAAAQFHPDYFLLLNNDTTVDENLVDSMVSRAEVDPSVAVVQAKILYYHDGTINSAGNLGDVFGGATGRGAHERDRGQYDRFESERFFYCSGACLLVARRFAENIGPSLFDSRLFAYYEDFDLSWRARLQGLKISFCSEAICHHKEGATSGGLVPWVAYLAHRNRLRVLLKNYSTGALFFAFPGALGLEFITSLATSIHRREPAFMTALLRAIGWNAKFLAETFGLRRSVQSTRKVTDRQVMKAMEWAPIDLTHGLGFNSRYWRRIRGERKRER